jgi:hypothetical protein
VFAASKSLIWPTDRFRLSRLLLTNFDHSLSLFQSAILCRSLSLFGPASQFAISLESGSAIAGRASQSPSASLLPLSLSSSSQFAVPPAFPTRSSGRHFSASAQSSGVGSSPDDRRSFDLEAFPVAIVFGAAGGFLFLVLVAVAIGVIRYRRRRLSLSYSDDSALGSPPPPSSFTTNAPMVNEMWESPLTCALEDLPFETEALTGAPRSADPFENDAAENVLG